MRERNVVQKATKQMKNGAAAAGSGAIPVELIKMVAQIIGLTYFSF
jgi:hypothetical protein